MATMSVTVCDVCEQVGKATLPCRLVVGEDELVQDLCQEHRTPWIALLNLARAPMSPRGKSPRRLTTA